MDKIRENIKKALTRYILNEVEMAAQMGTETPEYDYEPSSNNPSVQQYLEALEEWWAKNHDDLYDFDNLIAALDIFEDKVKAERDNFAAEIGVERKFIKEGIENEQGLESELEKLDRNLKLMHNRVQYNKADDMPDELFDKVKDLIRKYGAEVNNSASTTYFEDDGERYYYASVRFK